MKQRNPGRKVANWYQRSGSVKNASKMRRLMPLNGVLCGSVS
jgi:hypothetical protein